MMKKLTAFLLAMLLFVTLAGCGKTSKTTMESAEADVSGPSVVGEAPEAHEITQPSDSPVVATYVMVSASQDGAKLEADQLPVLTIVLKEDGTGTYGIEESGMDISWVLEGNQYTFVSPQIGPENPLVLTVDGNRLVAMDGNLEMIFEKQ